MSITLTNFLVKFNNLIGDNITGTTDSAGNAGKTNFIDSALSRYEDGYFGDPERNPEWWAYIASQLRTIKGFTQSSGTVEVHKAFTAQVGTATAYEIHKFDRDKKFQACNQALNEAYPWFYKRVEDLTTLDGKGSSNNEYTVPNTFTYFPDQIWEKQVATLVITYVPITAYEIQEAAGAFKFCADITLANDIILIGKKELTAFTTSDASTTELSVAQADVVVLLAVAIFYRNLSAIVNTTDSGRFDSLANRYEGMWEQKKLRYSMPMILPDKLDYGWLNE